MNDTGRNRTIRTVDFEEAVLQHFNENPTTSTRLAANMLDTNHMSVFRVLKEYKLHPYHIQKVHALIPEDYPQRINFCQWALNKIRVSPNFLNKVLFTDEASFSRDGILNSRNRHVWEYDNPHAIFVKGHQEKFSVNVWAGILNGRIIGPYILPNRLNSRTYLVFIRDILTELLEDIPLDAILGMWFQHDGAPAHFAQIVRDYLNNRYGQQWIGRGGPVAWPPRSPDLTPLDFFFWGQMKSLVYDTPVNDVMDLVARIEVAAATIQERFLNFNRLKRSMMNRYELCIEAAGQNFEHLL